jgi:hypothetical protein
VLGRFEGDESSADQRVLDRGVNMTTLSGEIQQEWSNPGKVSSDLSDNAYHVVEQTTGTLGDVRIAHGNADGTGADAMGGGIHMNGGRLENAFVQRNQAEKGGGLSIENNPSLKNLLVNKNDASTTAGAMYFTNSEATLTDIDIRSNTSTGVNTIKFVDSDPTFNQLRAAGDQPVAENTYTISGDIDNQDGDNLAGDIVITEPDGSSKQVSTNADGTFSVDVSSTNGFEDGETVDVTASNVTDYQSSTKQVTLDKDNRSTSTSFALDVSTTTKTIDFVTTVVGNDLFEDTDGDGLGYDDATNVHTGNGYLDELTLGYTDGSGNQATTTASFTDGDNDGVYNASATITYADTSSTVTFTQNDSDFIDTWVMNKTAGSRTAPDLRKDTENFATFADTPDYQSTINSNGFEVQDPARYDDNPIPRSELVESYEVRVIPRQGPRGPEVGGSRDKEWETSDNTISEWQPHIGAVQGGRWKEREVNGSSRSEVKLYIEDSSSDETYKTYAENAYSTLRDILPYPTSAVQTQAAPNEFNVVWTNNGPTENNAAYGFRYLEDANASFGPGDGQGSAVSELYSALSGGFGTSGEAEPNDTVMDSNSNLIKDKAEYPLRIVWSIKPKSTIRYDN